MWLAILVTILASAGNNVGKALQKEATRHLPRFSVDPKILLQYARSRQWLIGLATDLGGALLMIAAFALAPVSLVQPVSGLGLAVLSVFSHFYLKERLHRGEWAAVALAGLGTVGVGATSGTEPGGSGLNGEQEQAMPSATRIVAVMLLLCAAVAALPLVLARRTAAADRRARSAKPSASVYGLQARACFGMSAAACRTGFLLAARVSWTAAPAGLAASICLSSTGFALQTLGFKDGNTVVVCTCAAVSSMVTGVLVGLLALDERLPRSLSMRALRLLSWVAIALGVGALAGGKGGLGHIVHAVLSRLPSSVLTRLPTPMVLRMRALSQHLKSEHLPTVADVASDAPDKR
ncbi:g9974 [Coccomyxa elongata]